MLLLSSLLSCFLHYSALVLLVLTLLVCMPLMLALPRQVEIFSPARVQRYQKMGTEIPVTYVYLSVLQVCLQERKK